MIGLIVASVAIARAPRPITGAVVTDRLLAWYVVFSIGVTYLVNFVFHVFFGQMSAAFIGWADSPFQFEVGRQAWASRSPASSQRSAVSIGV